MVKIFEYILELSNDLLSTSTQDCLGKIFQSILKLYSNLYFLFRFNHLFWLVLELNSWNLCNKRSIYIKYQEK